jgi:hypothetical protein
LYVDMNSGAFRGREWNESLKERFHFLLACRLLLVLAGTAEEVHAVSGTPISSFDERNAAFQGVFWACYGYVD